MKLFKHSIFLIPIAFVLLLGDVQFAEAQRSILPSLGDSRSGTSGYQFLKINPDARSSAMGNSNVADARDGASLYLNPALSAQTNRQLLLGHTAYFADISLNYAGYIHRHKSMAFGGSLLYLDSGEMNETTEFAPFGTGRTFRTIHMAAGLSFAQELTTLFSYGITAKYIDERIEEVEAQNVVFDVGFFYRVGETGLRFAIGLSNFGVDASTGGSTTRPSLDGDVEETDFEDISPPTMFTMGAAYDLYTDESFNVLLTGQITNPSDNSEKFSFGTEVSYLDQFFLRGGYEFGVDEATYPSFGVGIKQSVLSYRLGVDYGFSSRERLGSLHRLALTFNF